MEPIGTKGFTTKEAVQQGGLFFLKGRGPGKHCFN